MQKSVRFLGKVCSVHLLSDFVMSCNEGLIEAGEQVGSHIGDLLCGFAKTQQYLLQMDLLELEDARLDNACPHFLSGDVGGGIRVSCENIDHQLHQLIKFFPAVPKFRLQRIVANVVCDNPMIIESLDF